MAPAVTSAERREYPRNEGAFFISIRSLEARSVNHAQMSLIIYMLSLAVNRVYETGAMGERDALFLLRDIEKRSALIDHPLEVLI